MTGVFDPYREWLGIDPQEHPVDHYRLLGLQRFESDVALINQAADACMVEIRLHQLGPHGRYTQQLLNEISTARVCLVQADSRTAYDAQLVGDAVPTVSRRECRHRPLLHWHRRCRRQPPYRLVISNHRSQSGPIRHLED